jgi:Na+/proline symporter
LKLATLDLVILVLYLGAIFALGIYFARRAGRSEESFFLAGRKLPWWLAGTSLMATSFSIDTPIGIAGLVEAHGIRGVWFAWCFAIGGVGMLGYALFAELWRRSEVMTDAELVELRYGGRSAAGLRLFKALYFGVLLNALTLAWVLKAIVGLGGELFDRPPATVLVLGIALTLVYATMAGFWGVVASDLPQYFIIFGGISFLAWTGVQRAGGVEGMTERLAERFGAGQGPADLSFVPAPSDPFFPTFLAYVLVLWWAHKNSNAAGAIVQRLAACKDEREARRSTLLFGFGTFAVNYWPMILLALAALALYPAIPADTGVARLIGENLPIGLRGLVVAALVAAFMSTVDSHLNLGSQYLVHDIVRRFLRKKASEREMVMWARGGTVFVLALAVAISYQLESVASAWTLLAALTSGYGLVTILRWFWWRINAWSEIAALGSSALVTVVVKQMAPDASFGGQLLWVVGLSTPVWLAATFLTPTTNAATLETFQRRVRPWGWWGRGGVHLGGLGGRILLWFFGTIALLGANFSLGATLLGQWGSLWLLISLTALAAALFWRFSSKSRGVKRLEPR